MRADTTNTDVGDSEHGLKVAMGRDIHPVENRDSDSCSNSGDSAEERNSAAVVVEVGA